VVANIFKTANYRPIAGKPKSMSQVKQIIIYGSRAMGSKPLLQDTRLIQGLGN